MGRDPELAALCAMLATRQSVCVTAAPGAGKTTLARAVAHRLGEEFTVIWNSADTDEPMDSRVMGIDSLLDNIAGALGLDVAPDGDIPSKISRVMEAMARTPALIVVDELGAASDARLMVELLTCLPKGCAALVTGAVAVEALVPFALGAFGAATELYKCLSGRELDASALVLPLAVDVVAATGADINAAWFGSALSKLSDDDRVTLARLSVLIGPVRAEQAYYMYGAAVQGALDRLTAARMLTLNDGLYGMHPLIRSLASEALSAEEAVFALRRAYEGLLASDPIVSAEYLYEWAMTDPGMLKEFAGYVRKLVSVLEMKGRRDMALRKCRQGIEASQRAGIRHSEADFLNQYGLITARRGDIASAMAVFDKALLVAREAANPQVESIILGNKAGILERDDKLDDALKCQLEGLAIARRIDDKHGVATALLSLGNIYQRRGEIELALESLRESASEFRAIGQRQSEGGALVNIALIEGRSGRIQEALKGFIGALDSFVACGDKSGAAYALLNIGALFAELGEMDEALVRLRQALEFYTQLQSEQGVAKVQRLIKRVQESRAP